VGRRAEALPQLGIEAYKAAVGVEIESPHLVVVVISGKQW